MRGRLRLCGGAALVCAVLHAQPAAIAPYTWTENFDRGNLAQFSSYPPSQDTGYDPTLAPAPGGGLMREVRPSRSGLARFGFLRRLDLTSVADGRLRIVYRIEHTRPEDRIEIGLAGADGRRYETVSAIEPGGWRTVEIATRGLVDAAGRAMPPHTGIDALYVVADLKRADADIRYRFQIRSVSIRVEPHAISTSVRALRAATPGLHPRLLFGAEDRERLAARTRDPQYAPIWRALVERAEAARRAPGLQGGSAIFALLDPAFLLPTLPGYFAIVDRAGPAIELNALEAYLTGSEEARRTAKRALLAVAEWNSWAPPWFLAHGQQTYYPAGLLAVQMALGYDLLFDDLTEPERAKVRASLMEHAIARPYREYVEDNRIPANTSNWIGHSVGGALVAAAAIWGDGAAPALELYTNGLLRKFEDHLAASYLADGSYGEGISYQEFDLQSTTLAMNALERVFGIDYWSRSHVADSLWYPIATLDPSRPNRGPAGDPALAEPVSGSLDMGDSHPPAGYSIAPVVARSRNPAYRWYYDHFPHRSLADFLYTDFSIPSKAPKAESRFFPEKGSVVLRSGEDGILLLYRAGANFNHNHADQGSFLLRAGGENLVTEAGYSDYYKDPHYDSYFKQAIGHNTVLVDRDPESQEVADNAMLPALDRRPRITDVLLSPQVDAVASELHQVYRGRLRRFERQIVRWEGSILVYDNLAATAPAATFDWLLHLPNRPGVRIENAGAIYTGAKRLLAMQRLFPAGAPFRVEDGHLPFSVFNPAAPASAPSQPGILKLSAKAASGQMRFLVALQPTVSEEDARQALRRLNLHDEPNWLVVERLSARGADFIHFRKEPGRNEGFNGRDSTDASMWMEETEMPSRGTLLLAGLGATTLKREGKLWFSSAKPVSFAADYDGGEIRLSVHASAAGRIRIARQDGSIAEVEVAAGEQELTVR